MNKKEYSTFEAMGQLYKDDTKIFTAKFNSKLIINCYGLFEVKFCGNDKCSVGDYGETSQVWKLKWTLKPSLVDWKTARKHMEKGRYCYREGGQDMFSIVDGYLYCDGLQHSSFNMELLDRKWELIE